MVSKWCMNAKASSMFLLIITSGFCSLVPTAAAAASSSCLAGAGFPLSLQAHRMAATLVVMENWMILVRSRPNTVLNLGKRDDENDSF